MALLETPPDSSPRSIADLFADLDEDGRLVHVEHFPARPATFAEPAEPIPDGIQERIGVDRLFSHQAEAIDLLRADHSVVIATGTASGKSLCYQVPIAESVPKHTALCLFPTKALAHDQLRSIGSMDFAGLTAATYDGDTDVSTRGWVRNHANVILTNPEMLHNGMLPHHVKWSRFLRRLRYIVIDELHTYRGVFGTHMAHLLRRLRRLAEHYGASPVFVFASATIGEPGRLASELCGLDVAEVTSDGSPKGPRDFALLNPPLIEESSGARASTTSETSAVIAELVRLGHRTIAFTASRKGTELVAGDVRRRLRGQMADSVRSYRGGYLAAERREIEEELATGQVAAVIATSALELGVDIGGLDACVLSGFPGTIASMWQQAGRAGRQGQLAASVLVAGDDMLDQWLMAHPHEVFERSPEPAVVNVTNPFIADPHLACAAYELPLGHDDAYYWPEIDDSVMRLVRDDKLLPRMKGDERIAVWTGKGSPARGIGLRSGSSSEVKIQTDDGTLIGTVDEGRAPSLVHTGAIYLHRGESWKVTELDLDANRAVVEQSDGSEYTQARSATDISILGTEQTRDVGPATLSLGQVEVTTTVTGYQRKERRTRKILGNHVLELPPQRLITRAFWYTVDDPLLDRAGLGWADLPGTLHAAEHAAIGMLPLFTICGRWDVGGVSTAHHADTEAPTIFIYDGYPGGTGIAELGWAAADRHLAATLDLVAACPCEDGCPSCVQSPKCGNGNDPLDKHGAIALLREIVSPPAGRP